MHEYHSEITGWLNDSDEGQVQEKLKQILKKK